MKRSHQEKVKIARRAMTPGELIRQRGANKQRARTSIWGSTFWTARATQIGLRVKKQEETVRLKKANDKNN